MITDSENFFIQFLIAITFFFKIRPPFWVRHFEFDKSDIKFVISDPEKLIEHAFGAIT
jgi:hypothetical protein